MSVHDEKTVSCYGDGEHERKELIFEQHGRFVRSAPPEAGVESSALRFDCPECGETYWQCPVCSDPDDRSPAGWIDGSSGSIPCHNCNQKEVIAQRRRGGIH